MTTLAELQTQLIEKACLSDGKKSLAWKDRSVTYHSPRELLEAAKCAAELACPPAPANGSCLHTCVARFQGCDTGCKGPCVHAGW